jgi:hypothetical protein
MYIIAIGYAYVIFMVTLVVIMGGDWLKGIAIALFLGVLPLWVFVKAVPRGRLHVPFGQGTRAPDGKDAQADQ